MQIAIVDDRAEDREEPVSYTHLGQAVLCAAICAFAIFYGCATGHAGEGDSVRITVIHALISRSRNAAEALRREFDLDLRRHRRSGLLHLASNRSKI